MRRSGDEIFLGIVGVVVALMVLVPGVFMLKSLGEGLYWRFIEKPLNEKREAEARSERIEAERIAAEEAAQTAQSQEEYYRNKYENKIYYEIFGSNNLVAENYEYLGIEYDVYKSGALFIRKTDDRFSIPEIMEYEGTEYQVIGIDGQDILSGSYNDKYPGAYYLWEEETFPANWKYIFNVCFADGLTRVVIPETVEYYEITQLPSYFDAFMGEWYYENTTLEEIVIESKFDPREWCFHGSFEEHKYYLEEAGYGDVYNEEYLCLPEKFTNMNCMYRYYSALKKVTIPAWTTAIYQQPSGLFGNDAITFCKNPANKIEVPPTVRYVNLNAFAYVPLTEFNFYPGVTYDGTISGWKVKELDLTRAYSFPGTITVADCSELETLYISAATRDTETPSYVIRNCPNLKTIYIDSGDLLSNVSISDCGSLETATIINLPPSGNDNMFSNVNGGFTLKVPAKYVEYYSVIYSNLNVVACD